MSEGKEHLGGQFETLYHLTDKRNFKLNPKKVPADNALAINQRSRPGLYATAGNVEHWWNGYNYHRPYVAEVQVPKGVAQEERWGGEKFIPGEHLNKAQVSRVIPVDAHVREHFGEPGWVEEHHGTSFDAPGEALPSRGGFRGYRYEGPDVREFTPEQHAEHSKRIRSYRKTREQM
jgi:hypothetical protein